MPRTAEYKAKIIVATNKKLLIRHNKNYNTATLFLYLGAKNILLDKKIYNQKKSAFKLFGGADNFMC